MNRRFICYFATVVLSLFTNVGTSLAADVKGSQDHPVISRFPGSEIVGYFHRDFEQVQLPRGPGISYNTGNFDTADTVEGELTRIVYLSPTGKGPLEVFRNYEQALKGAGLKVKFSCSPPNCQDMNGHWMGGTARREIVYPAGFYKFGNWPDIISGINGYSVSGTLTSGGREVHIVVYSAVAAKTESNATATVVDIVEPKTIETGLITVDASAMSKGLASEGKIAIYGLYFDTGKAIIKPESKPQLEQMAKLLKDQTSLYVFIVGHTDSQGVFETNLTLSKQRAEAVRDALVNTNHIPSARMIPYGVGNVSPVASNKDETGRSKNRRVELVLR